MGTARLGFACPHDVRQTLNLWVFGVNESVCVVHQLTYQRTEALDIAGCQVGQVAEILLMLYDGIEVAAISYIHDQPTQLRHHHF